MIQSETWNKHLKGYTNLGQLTTLKNVSHSPYEKYQSKDGIITSADQGDISFSFTISAKGWSRFNTLITAIEEARPDEPQLEYVTFILNPPKGEMITTTYKGVYVNISIPDVDKTQSESVFYEIPCLAQSLNNNGRWLNKPGTALGF